ncbi:MAG: 50S ribosomal protein L6 [Thaumarchaeota archaeon]|nr:50S ribosomal protein L6 [Nitrososphaerota archaeon]
MATSTKGPAVHAVDLIKGVTASVDGRVLSVKGPLGTVKKNFNKIHVNIGIDSGKVQITSFSAKKKDVVSSNTVSSLVRNMVTGVTEGYLYKMKVVFAHFPVTVKVKGNTVVVENFMGERSARVTKIVGDCKVTIDGDDIIIKGVSLEDVGQTSANLEQATKIKRKDQRIFLDGVYVYEKKKGW